MQLMHHSFVAALLGLASFADARVMEALRMVPQGWTAVGVPEPSRSMMFRIAMHQPHHDEFEEKLFAVSTPGHALYGQHLRRDDVKELLRPDVEATKAVLEWLQDSGIPSDRIVDDGEWINFHTNISTAEKLLRTKFNVYRSQHKKIDKIRTLEYSVPQQLHQYIDMIQPTIRFGQIRPQSNNIHDYHIVSTNLNAVVNASCNATVTPQCLKDLYNVKPVPGLENCEVGKLGINGFLEEYARYDDFAQFTSLYAPYLKDSNFTYQLINGGKDDQNSTSDSIEANLDAQYGLALSYPVKATYYSTGGRAPLIPDLDEPDASDSSNEPYLDFLTYLVAQDNKDLPTTLTTSYGEDEQSVPFSYQTRVCSLFGQLGARGVSVIFSSGDTGPGSACQTNDGRNATRFNAIFPAGCATVTSVGGTVGVNPERAVSFSSGGFSDRVPRPKYQDKAVSAYLSKIGDTFKGLFNPKGRGFPDVAAQGRGFRVVDKGRVINVGGTSASAPTFAGIVALLNAARKSKGLPTLGFLNPFIYSEGYKALTDIVDGGSRGCTGVDIYSGLPSPRVIGAGWNATKGWDPVTGLGTPDFGKLLELVVPGGYH